MKNLENEHITHLECDKQEADQLTWNFEKLKNELELKDEQIKRQEEQLRENIAKTKEHEYCPLLESKFKEYENEIKRLKEEMKNQALEIERITEEREKLNGKVQYLNSQVEMLSTEISQQEPFSNHAKISDQLVGKVDNAERNSSSKNANYGLERE